MTILYKLKTSSFILLAVLILSANLAKSQTFTGTGGVIPNNNTNIDFNQVVFGLPAAIDTANFGLETVCINITHSNDQDLEVSLVAPDGTIVLLTSGNGGSGNNYTGTCFNSNAVNNIASGMAPFTGTYKPQGTLGLVNNGQNPYGVWKLRIKDKQAFIGTGSLVNWTLTFGNAPASYFTFSSSDLPIVVLNTFGLAIPNDPKITAHMGIIDNGPGMINHLTDSSNGYDGTIGIELRGQSSTGFPQLQYAVETRDILGQDSTVVLLGMPKESDWILYAPYTDKTCIRNALSYDISNKMGRYAVRTRFCEVVLNGDYIGIYALTENIKRDSNRVDISKLTVNDTIGDQLTGGYIVKIDKVDGPSWNSIYPPDQTNPATSNIKYQMVYPKATEILAVQQNYIKMYIDSFENALASANFTNPLTGWRKYADESSVIDFLLANEISKNVDGYRISSYFYKDKASTGGKLIFGPIWDYNIAWHNADYCNNEPPANWSYRTNDYCNLDIPFWWRRFMLDAQFKNNLKCRWISLRSGILDTAAIFSFIDSNVTVLNQAKDRHFDQWPILGTYVWPNPSPIANTYAEEITNLKQWIQNRFAWLDANMPGICNPAGNEELFGSTEFMVYPNPANDKISISTFHLFKESASVEVFNTLGQAMLNTSINANTDRIEIDLSGFKSGIYYVKLMDGKIAIGVKQLVKL